MIKKSLDFLSNSLNQWYESTYPEEAKEEAKKEAAQNEKLSKQVRSPEYQKQIHDLIECIYGNCGA